MTNLELDIEEPRALVAYLRAADLIDDDEMPAMQTLHGGVSNRTVLVERDNGQAWVLKQALAKLRVPVDWFSSPERVHREALGLRWLIRLAPEGTIPELVFEDHETHLIGMQAVPQPHDNWKTLLLAGQLDQGHVAQFGRLLAAVHGNAYRRRDEVATVFSDRTFFESLRLEPYYGYAAQQVPDAATFLNRLITETRTRSITLVHGDYSPKNILVRHFVVGHANSVTSSAGHERPAGSRTYVSSEDRLVLLDHEVIHWGDPAFDLGFSMTHLLSKAHHLQDQRSAFAESASRYWQIYVETLGDLAWRADLETYAVRHTLACLLARVEGRSPLEYLNGDERRRQREAVVALMDAPPDRIDDLVASFIGRL